MTTVFLIGVITSTSVVDDELIVTPMLFSGPDFQGAIDFSVLRRRVYLRAKRPFSPRASQSRSGKVVLVLVLVLETLYKNFLLSHIPVL